MTPMKGYVMNPESTGVRLTKFAAKTVVGFGVGKIAGDIIKNNTRVPVTKIDKITITAGAFAIGMMASDAVEDYVTAYIDKLITEWNEFRGNVYEDEPAS